MPEHKPQWYMQMLYNIRERGIYCMRRLTPIDTRDGQLAAVPPGQVNNEWVSMELLKIHMFFLIYFFDLKY